MVKSNIDMLSLRKKNFKISVKSQRISKKRNTVHNRINIIKKNFLAKREEIYDKLENKDDVDIITRDPVKSIPQKDLYIYEYNNKKYGISSINLLRWMSKYDYDEIPVNPLNNIEMSELDRRECYKIAKKYYISNPFYYVNNLLTKENIEERKKLYKIIKRYSETEYYRLNPGEMLECYQSIIIEEYKKIYSIILDNNIRCPYNMLCFHTFNHMQERGIIIDDLIINKIEEALNNINYYINLYISLYRRISNGL